MTTEKYQQAIENIQIGDRVEFFLDSRLVNGYNSEFINDIRELIRNNIEIFADNQFIQHVRTDNTHFYEFFSFENNNHVLQTLKEIGIKDWNGTFPIFKKIISVETEIPKKVVKHEFKIKDMFNCSDDEIKNIKLEMINKIDKKRFAQILSIAGSYDREVKFCNKEVIDLYLNVWAENKWKLYVLFGKQLSIKKEIKIQMNDDEMQSRIRELGFLYPKYVEVLTRINYHDYVINSMNNYSLDKEFYPFLENGMKVSKFLSNLFEDQSFDQTLSVIMQDKMIDSNIFISIDPYDYATMSINKSGWRSCHSIVDGEYGGGGLSYMMDNNSTIAYRSNGNDCDYSFYNFKFRGNNKIWRQLVNIDINSFSAVFGRQYPNISADLAKEVRTLYEDWIDVFIGNGENDINEKEFWKIKHNSAIGDFVVENDNFIYYDVNHGWDFKCVYLPSQIGESNIKISVGAKDLYDVYTCEKISRINGRRVTVIE